MIDELKQEVEKHNARIAELQQREQSISAEIGEQGEALENAIAEGTDTSEIIGQIRSLEAERSAIPGAIAKLQEKRRVAKNQLSQEEAEAAKQRLKEAAEQIREPVEIAAEALEALAAEIEALPARERDTFQVLRLPNNSMRFSALPDVLRGFIDREAREKMLQIDTSALHRQAPAREPEPEQAPNYSPMGKVFGGM